ncbi:MAG: DUF1499 domain-containing protein [Candidatus Lokiarchaeota archaeon]|nr:DUF1499 domain-containing protein [Candidatus Lokiarchaeota archaeon]MBD3201440.1 DUF1499 domain-containing protein [Candidatus Lokiarchaeota archaeon]
MPSEERKVGLKEGGKFYPCPEKHVCVSSQAPKDDEKHYIDPLPLNTSVEEAKKKMIEVINSMSRTEILENNDKYIRAKFTTFLFKFKDDVEVYFDEKDNLIHLRSQSRIGGFDWNKNKNRINKIKKKFNKL